MLDGDTYDNLYHPGASQGEDATQGDINPVADSTHPPFSFRRDDLGPVRDIGRKTKSAAATPEGNRNRIQATKQQTTSVECTPQGK